MVGESSGLFKNIMYHAALTMEGLGVAVICIGVIATTAIFVYRAWEYRSADRFYHSYRRSMGKAILLGLELLVAGDIILTATHNFDLQHVGLLGLLVLVRTFLSFSLEIELNGHLPWRRPPELNESGNFV